jgi:hypothetical protein
MSLIERFFNKDKPKANAGPGQPLAANPNMQNGPGLQVMLNSDNRLNAMHWQEALRHFDRSMTGALVELDGDCAAQGTPLGLVGWGKHVIKVVGFNAPLPSDVVDLCLNPAHYDDAVKDQQRAGNRAHVLLYYAGYETDPLEQYVALAATAGTLLPQGALAVTNEAARTALPAAVLSDCGAESEGLDVLHGLPIALLYTGLVKYDVENVPGVWMRTFANHFFGLPNFARHAEGHHQGSETLELFSALTAHFSHSSTPLNPGDTMQLGDELWLKARLLTEDEAFLELDEHPLLVLDFIASDQINQP